MRKDVEFKEVKGLLIDDVAQVCIRATSPVMGHSRMEIKFKENFRRNGKWQRKELDGKKKLQLMNRS